MIVHAIDQYAGPGGWDHAARALGFDPWGIEFDAAACATRDAVGLRTIKADITTISPRSAEAIAHGCDLLISSAPCPTFSDAGKRAGIADLEHIYASAIAIGRGEPEPGHGWRDDRSALVLEPLRWALALKPAKLAWEQVPPILPFWELCAGILREHGWNVWTGILEAERYGVAQTRERAFLMADRTRHVEPPRPTHQRYVKGEPARHEHTLKGEILPWVSMAEALGWAPADEVGFPRRADGEDEGEFRDRDRRSASEPSFTLGEKARSWDRVRTGHRTGDDGDDYERGAEDPAPTVTGRTDRWTHDRPAPTFTGGNRTQGGVLVYPDWRARRLVMGNQENATERGADEPAPTVLFGHKSNDVKWVHERPSTTVAGDPRVSAPGWRGAPKDYDEEGNYHGERSMDNAVRVTLEEAAVLQSFPPDYPFQGTKTKRFEQVGNAVPPLLAKAVLEALL